MTKLSVYGGINIGRSLVINKLLKTTVGSINLKDSLLCKGDAHVSGSIHANKILVHGTLNVSGKCTAKSVFCGNLHLSGGIECFKLKVAKKARITGYLNVENIITGKRLEIELEQFKSSKIGSIYVGGDLIIKSRGGRIIIKKDVNASNIEIENAEIHGNILGKTITLKNCIVYGNVIYKDTFINNQSKILGKSKMFHAT